MMDKKEEREWWTWWRVLDGRLNLGAKCDGLNDDGRFTGWAMGDRLDDDGWFTGGAEGNRPESDAGGPGPDGEGSVQLELIWGWKWSTWGLMSTDEPRQHIHYLVLLLSKLRKQKKYLIVFAITVEP